MNSENTVISGHLGRDAEVITANEKTLVKFSVAVGYGKRDNRKTTWYDVVTWHGVAKACVNLKKGEAVIVSGKMRCNDWEDREGAKRRSWTLQADIVGKVLYVSEKRPTVQAPQDDPPIDSYDEPGF